MPSKGIKLSWYVVRSKLRQELKARDCFQSAGFDAYVPSQIKIVETKSGQKKREVPAITGYVFVQLPQFNYQTINNNPLVTNVIKRNGKVVEVHKEEVDVMKKHLNTAFAPTDFDRVAVGDSITLEHGAFSGNEGEVVELKKNKIILNLKSIAMRLSIALN